jgi:hypothetical protein
LLLASSGCAVAAEMDPSSATDTAVETPDANTGAPNEAGAWGAPSASGGSGGSPGPADSGSAGGSGAGAGGDGATPVEAGVDGASNGGAGNGELCPTTTEYALKFFDALKAGAQQVPCNENSCTANQCCYKTKLCIEK